jgi:aspartate aminotransferase-like enzyme
MEKLLTAGPVSLDSRVLRALSGQMVSHREEGFHRIVGEIEEGLKKAYGTSGGTVCILSGSGTLAVDAMVNSMVRRGENVLLISHGEFGNRLGDSISKRGAHPTRISAPDGIAVEESAVYEAIESGKYGTVAMVYTETSIGMAHRSSGAIGKFAKKHGLKVIVDAASAMFGEDIRLDTGCFDAVSTCSQKCLAAPPGIALVGLSEEAMGIVGHTEDVNRYLDLGLYARKMNEGYDIPQTPAVSLFYGLREALRIMLEAGMDEWMGKHMRLAAELYSELPKHGYARVVKDSRFLSNSVTAFEVPQGHTSRSVMSRLMEGGYVVSEGMGSLKGKSIRIGTMGDVSGEDISNVIGILQDAAR